VRIFTLLCILAFVAFPLAIPSHAQRIELFGGYTFVRAPVTFSQTPQGACVITGCPTTITTRNLKPQGLECGRRVQVLGPGLRSKPTSPIQSGSFQGANTHL